MITMSENSLSERALIWDLGGVLADISWKGYAYAIGIKPFLNYMLSHARFPKRITKRSFEVLHHVVLPTDLICEGNVCIPGGLLMPPVMVAYQAGRLHRKDIIPLVQTALEKLERENYFKSVSEYKLIDRVIDEVFNPETLVRYQRFVPHGVQLVQTLASQHTAFRTRRYKQYVLSNWDPVSFHGMYKQSSDFFALFDGIVVSGIVGMVKPSIAIFDYLIEHHTIDKASAVFIDDQPENVWAASSCGIGTALLFKNFKQLEHDLVAVGIQVRE